MSNNHYIGELDARIELIQFSYTQTTTGAPIKTESSLGSVWCKIIDVSGSEDEEGKIRALNVRKYVIRYQSTVYTNASNIYIKDADGTYNINHAEEVGRKHFLVLKAQKRE